MMYQKLNLEKNVLTEADTISMQPLKKIDIDECELSILGTAHVSRASVDAVQKLIITGNFDAIAVELCNSRYEAIANPDAIAKMDLFQVIKSGRASMVAASLALGAFQQRMAEQLGIEPGAEMRVAIKDAQARNLPVLLIDREIGTTLKRIYHNVPWWKRISLFAGLIASIISREQVSESEIEKLKAGDVLESTFTQFAEDAKDLYLPLINERDQYMSARLLQEIRGNGYRHVLAVVGAGHMRGMEQQLVQNQIEQPGELITQLDAIPESANWIKYLPWFVVVLIIIGFVVGFMRSPEIGTAMLIDWVLINGVLSALGAVIALGHPLTVMTAFIAAPITSLNPTIGAGMVVAAVETYIRKPKVGDFNQLRSDTTSLKGWWSNQVTRILLVFLFSTFGSAVGTYVAGFRIFERLSGG